MNLSSKVFHLLENFIIKEVFLMTLTQEKVDHERLVTLINELTVGLDVDHDDYVNKILRNITGNEQDDYLYDQLIKNALENLDDADPDWTYVASRAYLRQLYEKAAENRSYNAKLKYGDFYSLLKTLADKGIYSEHLLQIYSEEDIQYFAKQILPERDLLFDYLGLYTLATRYLATDYAKNVYELPQERWMVIAMHLMHEEETSQRNELVVEAYWALSNLYMTVATPTMNNAGKSHGQLSSCFIDTVDDSLQAIYDSNTDIAKLSKNGGGIGVYMGKVRGRGSSIKGFKGMSSGVVPWIK